MPIADSAEAAGAFFVARTVVGGVPPSQTQGETAMPFYEKGDVRIRYEETGSLPIAGHPGGRPELEGQQLAYRRVQRDGGL
jgi:hypothetical protein